MILAVLVHFISSVPVVGFPIQYPYKFSWSDANLSYCFIKLSCCTVRGALGSGENERPLVSIARYVPVRAVSLNCGLSGHCCGWGGPNAKKEWLEGEACFLLGGVLLDRRCLMVWFVFREVWLLQALEHYW